MKVFIGFWDHPSYYSAINAAIDFVRYVILGANPAVLQIKSVDAIPTACLWEIEVEIRRGK